MGQQFKRQRIKTGPNSWVNITQHKNGTTTRSVSNKAGNTTTNVGVKGVRKTQNNSGWVLRSNWSYKPKKVSSKSARSSPNGLWKRPASRGQRNAFDAEKFANNIEELSKRVEKGKLNAENWTKSEWWAFITIVTIVCIVIQLGLRALR